MNRLQYGKILMVFALLSIIAWTMGGHAAAEGAEGAQNVKIIINGREIASDVQPVIVNDRTYVPLRVVSENLGATVNWLEDSRQVVINWRTTDTPSLPQTKPGEIPIILDGQVLNIPASYGQPFINSQWRTMIPLRAVGEALDCEVKWIAESYTVDICSKSLSADRNILTDLAAYKTNLKLMDGSVINSGELINRTPASFSSEQIAVFKTYREQLSEYGATVVLPSGETINSADLTIMGTSSLTAAQLNKWVANEIALRTPSLIAQGRTINPAPDIAELYLEIGAQYGIRGDLAFCQSAKETGYWQYTGRVQPWQNNYCGLWATGSPLTGLESRNGADETQVCFMPGTDGAVFATPAAGVEAHIQHLYAYATKQSLPAGKVLIDPRYSLVNRGIAPSWLGLNARWAVPGTTYGQSIINDYWLKAIKTK